MPSSFGLILRAIHKQRYERAFPIYFILPSVHLGVFFFREDVHVFQKRRFASHGSLEEKRRPIAGDVGVHGAKRSRRARDEPIHHAKEPQKQLAKN
jgi:hypothetical protein